MYFTFEEYFVKRGEGDLCELLRINPQRLNSSYAPEARLCCRQEKKFEKNTENLTFAQSGVQCE